MVPVASSPVTSRTSCTVPIGRLRHVTCLVKRTIIAIATGKRAYVNGVAEDMIVVGLIRTAANRGARGRVALRGVPIVTAGARTIVIRRVVRRLVPLVFKWYPKRRS